MKRAVASLLLLAVCPAATASEISISHAAIERLLVTKVLKQDGRLYLEGSPTETCRFAFIQDPKVSGDTASLHIRFVFSGRAGVKVGGRCAGPGDTLTLTATGVPTYADGELSLSNLRLEAPDSAYFRAVSGLIEGQIERRLRFPVRAQLANSIRDASAGAAVQLALSAFDVRTVAVDGRGLRFVFDGSLTAQ